MNLDERVAAMDEVSKIQVAIEFLELALPLWELFVNSEAADLTYYAEFFGMITVDDAIVKNAIHFAKQFVGPHSTEYAEVITKEIKAILEAYSDHNSGISHQELDLEYNAELVFYAAFNLLCYIDGKKPAWQKESNAYISINQSIDALTRSKTLEWEPVRAILTRYDGLS